jgi:hypothetical protein
MKTLLMTVAIVTHIIFPGNDRREQVELRNVHAVSCDSTWKNLTDWCEIKLPRNVKDFDKQAVKDYFKRDDAVQVYLGYGQDLQLQFTGYVTGVGADTPIVLKCEDEMYKLKQLPVNISLASASLLDLLQQIAPGYEIDALEVNLGAVRYPKTTVSEVLKDLKDNYGLQAYFQGSTLVVGKIYADNTAEHDIHIETDCSKNDLKYIDNADRLVEVTAVSTMPDGSKLEVTVGDPGGEVKQLTYYNIDSEAELEKLANIDLAKYKLDGFEGSIECFGFNNYQHGDTVNLTSTQYPERNGTYFIDKVVTKMDATPKLRRILTLGEKA